MLKSTKTPVASKKMRQMEVDYKMVGVVKEQMKEVTSLTTVGPTHKPTEVSLIPTPKPSPRTNQEIQRRQPQSRLVEHQPQRQV